MTFRHAAGLLLVAVLGIGAARSETFVGYQPVADGPDLEEAVEFLSSYLSPAEYDLKALFEATGIERYRDSDNTIEGFIREIVRIGKFDVNGDGEPERFYLLSSGYWCGSAGCKVLIVESGSHGGRLLCSAYSGETGLVVTDRVTIHGWHELRMSFDVYWHDGDTCDEDIPGGDGYQPPRRDPLRP